MNRLWIPAIGFCLLFGSACSVVEQSSTHGFDSGYYTVKSDTEKLKKAYLDIQEDSISVFIKENDTLQLPAAISLYLTGSDTICSLP